MGLCLETCLVNQIRNCSYPNGKAGSSCTGNATQAVSCYEDFCVGRFVIVDRAGAGFLNALYNSSNPTPFLQNWRITLSCSLVGLLVDFPKRSSCSLLCSCVLSHIAVVSVRCAKLISVLSKWDRSNLKVLAPKLLVPPIFHWFRFGA